MPITVDNAIAAGSIANKIADRNKMVDLLQRAVSEGWQVSSLRATSSDGNEYSLILSLLDQKSSSQAFGFAIQVYQSQIADLTSQLGAIQVS